VGGRGRAAARPLADPALARAGALFLLATRHAKPILVLMPYCERLAATADWFCQLWAESLGKARDLAGRTVEWGQTPVRALGAADQHSQLQLYVEGPPDKVLLFLLETATVAVGALAGIDPFGQPGVEEGKRLAYGLMGRPGFEANRAEMEAWLARKDARFIL